MSRVSISKSYAVLLGLEGYMKTKKHMREGVVAVEHEAEKIFRPEKARAREEKAIDKSESARKEREYLAKEETIKKEQNDRDWKAKRDSLIGRRRDGETGSGSESLMRRFKSLGKKIRRSTSSTTAEDGPSNL